ncbi:MAG: bifunctional metallophosphatase/5'-nucleotidase [Chloroflexi bacterium]|nr:bifunctional metallophosphatase/5'-nucleotidase [Chloroflexota bacterium]
MKLVILHTNDIHGRVSQLERIATLVRDIRSEVNGENGHCLFVDAGDSEDTILLESSLTKGSAMNAILRGAGCDYAALGNAIPMRYGPQAVADLAKHFGRPLLCANFIGQDHKLAEGLEPYTIHDFGTFKLGIIGMTDPGGGYNTFFKMNVALPDDMLPGLIQQVRAQGAQTILLLSHLGLRDDKRVAENISGIDLLIGGHSHDLLDPPLQISGTIVAQAGEHGKHLGRIDLTIDPANGKITHFESTLIPIDESISPDPHTQSVVESERARAQQIMSREIGILAESFDLADDRECAAGNLLADALLERVKNADFSLVLAGHWETGLEQGALTQGQLFTAIRSTANPAWIKLTGSQIKQFVREALKPENAERKLHSLRGRSVGMPHVGGARIVNGKDGFEIEYQGKIITDEETYLVAATDMEFSNRIEYLVIPFETIEFEVPTIVPEVLEDYIRAHTPLSPRKS